MNVIFSLFYTCRQRILFIVVFSETRVLQACNLISTNVMEMNFQPCKITTVRIINLWHQTHEFHFAIHAAPWCLVTELIIRLSKRKNNRHNYQCWAKEAATQPITLKGERVICLLLLFAVRLVCENLSAPLFFLLLRCITRGWGKWRERIEKNWLTSIDITIDWHPSFVRPREARNKNQLIFQKEFVTCQPLERAQIVLRLSNKFQPGLK